MVSIPGYPRECFNRGLLEPESAAHKKGDVGSYNKAILGPSPYRGMPVCTLPRMVLRDSLIPLCTHDINIVCEKTTPVK